jgi:predicted nucleic acid-binding protein
MRTPLVTTDVVILEFVTLARKDVSLGKIEEYMESIFESATVEYTMATDLHSAWRLLKNYSAIPFSGFDASSLAVMERLEISRALTIDDEFIRCNRFIEVRPTYPERKTVLNP